MQQYELGLDVVTETPKPKKRTRRKAKLPFEEGGQDMTNQQKSNFARNRVLIARYYYWTEVRRRRFDDVMRILAVDEFFVGERTVSNTLLDCEAYLNELYSAKKDIRELKKEYPSWNWDAN